MVNYKTFKGATFEQIQLIQEVIRDVAKSFGNTDRDMVNFEHCYMTLNLLHWKVCYIKGFSAGTRKHVMKSFINCVKNKVYYKMRATY